MTQFATARIPTPVFNTPSIANYLGGQDGASVLLDAQQLMRCVETVLLPHTKIQLLQPSSPLWKIKTEEYPYPGDFFVPEHCLNFHTKEPPQRTVRLPTPDTLLKMAERLTGARYIWGGNWPLGVPALTECFAPLKPLHSLPPLTQDTWQLKGVDCSGLLYFLSDGYTPRNTSRLLHFGHPVTIEGLRLEQLLNTIRPLDLIVFPGHVILVLNPTTSIESRVLQGIVQRPLKERLEEVLETRAPINDSALCTQTHFVIRRWHPTLLT